MTAVSIHGMLEDLYSLKPEQIAAEIAELERRLAILREFHRIVQGKTAPDIPLTGETPAAEQKKRDGASYSYNITPDELKSVVSRIEECLLANGSLIFSDLLRHTKLNPAYLKRGIESSRIVKDTVTGRYSMPSV